MERPKISCFLDLVDEKVAFFAEKREESKTGPWFGANRLLSWPRWLLPVPGPLLVAILPLCGFIAVQISQASVLLECVLITLFRNIGCLMTWRPVIGHIIS